MRKTALILAGAIAFDLGVMAVSAQAQQQTGDPSRGPAPGAGPATTGLGGAYDKLGRVGALPVQDSPTARRGTTGDSSGGRDCTDQRPSGPCAASSGAGPATASGRWIKGDRVEDVQAAPPRGPVFPKIARVDTIPACGPEAPVPCSAETHDAGSPAGPAAEQRGVNDAGASARGNQPRP